MRSTPKSQYFSPDLQTSICFLAALHHITFLLTTQAITSSLTKSVWPFQNKLFQYILHSIQSYWGTSQMPSRVRGAYLTPDLLRQVGLSSFQDASVYSSPALSGTIQSDERAQSLESKRHLSAWVSSVWDCEATSDCGSHDPLVKSHPTQSLTSQFWGQSGFGLLHELIPEVARCHCESFDRHGEKEKYLRACTHPVGKRKHHSACKLRQKGKYCHYHTICHFVFVFLYN